MSAPFFPLSDEETLLRSWEAIREVLDRYEDNEAKTVAVQLVFGKGGVYLLQASRFAQIRAPAIPESGSDLLLRAILRGVATWIPEPVEGSRRGNIHVGGMRFDAKLDDRGKPIIEPPVEYALRAAIEKGPT